MQLIVLDLPVPPSVNRTRRVNWSARADVERWTAEADKMVTLQWSGGRRPKPIAGPYEIGITINEKSRRDIDNVIKSAIDYCRRLEVVADDSPKYLRRALIKMGDVVGCRVELRPFNGEAV